MIKHKNGEFEGGCNAQGKNKTIGSFEMLLKLTLSLQFVYILSCSSLKSKVFRYMTWLVGGHEGFSRFFLVFVGLERVSRIHLWTILKMVQGCIWLTRLTLVCEVIMYCLVQVLQNLKKRLFGLAACNRLSLSLPFSFSSSSYLLSFSKQKLGFLLQEKRRNHGPRVNCDSSLFIFLLPIEQ